ncbi:hypothetical protein DYB32_000417 [Aphanomyces invadans]|uniref:Uncharacterized protein n=1 Tax=Aphanomyces invadans TaxID=157072 RepID=A0A3R7AG65_9STRA|nr:hypothetical protein DYB32_000417 [Aphanomyces invadans]
MSSWVSLGFMAPFTENDLWWPHFNSTGLHTFLGELYLIKLTTDDHGQFSLFDDNAALSRDYSAPTTKLLLSQSTCRRILLQNLSLDIAISTLRRSSFSDNIVVVPLPCWLDFGRRFDMAHTSGRQERCHRRMKWNGGVYLESLLRNTRTSDWMSSAYFNALQMTVFESVHQLNESWAISWFTSLQLPWLDAPDEATLWQKHGISRWQQHLQNRFLEGTLETISIVNGLGIAQVFTVSEIPATPRALGSWSTQFASCGLENDLNSCMLTNTTLIRGLSNSFEAMGYDWDVYYNGPNMTVGSQLIRSYLGPLVAIDITLVPIPQMLLGIVRGFRETVWSSAQFNLIRHASTTLDPAPPSWLVNGTTFYGGNPMCPFDKPKPFVQAPFGYYDECDLQGPHVMPVTPQSSLFALLALDKYRALSLVQTTCSSCISASVACVQYLHSILAASNSVDAPLDLAASFDQAATQLVGIKFIQFARTRDRDAVLTQTMVQNPPDLTWTFFGWVAMYDWVNGLREVYTFAGDNGLVTLMSRPHGYLEMAANPLELQAQASKYVWYGTVYVSAVLGCVGLVLVLYGAKTCFQVEGLNLFQVNRIIGGVWIGRPLLMTRGFTALTILNTCSMAFVVDRGVSRLVLRHRPWWQNFLLASEACWITYALNDGLLPLTQRYSHLYAPVSVAVSWTIVFVLSMLDPYDAQAMIHRNCTIVSFKHGVECSNGAIHVGSLATSSLMFWLAVASVVGSYTVVRCFIAVFPSSAPRNHDKHELMLLHASSDAYFAQHNRQLDAVACAMSGILPIRKVLFDITSWSVHQETAFVQVQSSFQQVHLSMANLVAQTARLPTIRTRGGLGLLIMILSVASSFIFLKLSDTSMHNDNLWGHFTPATHAYMCNWFNFYLQLSRHLDDVVIDAGTHGLVIGAIPNTTVLSSQLYAASIQDEVNSLVNVIQGLRRMDGCLVPWIATAYCFVDFNRTWEMANTPTRQQRCNQRHRGNGAVYLEAVLRNAEWSRLSVCWGDALDVGIFSTINTSTTGLAWIAAVQANALPAEDEALFWTAQHISTFTTQWQNYKRLGVVESILTNNALGRIHQWTLKRSTSSLQLAVQSSFKLHWMLANDLIAVVTPNTTSPMAGRSLVRTSPSFAFSNNTPDAVLIHHGILDDSLRWDQAFMLFQTTIGPFGSVDTKRVSPPRALRQVYRNISESVMLVLRSQVMEHDDEMNAIYTLSPQPTAWDGAALWGGDLLCGRNVGSYNQPLQFFSYQGSCGIYLVDKLHVTSPMVMHALVAAGLLFLPTMPPIWQRDTYDSSVCKSMVLRNIVVLEMYLSRSLLHVLVDMAQRVKTAIRDDIQIQLVQYIARPSALDRLELSQVNLFDRSETDLEFFSWLYLFEWVEGTREVVAFEGDVGGLVTLSAEASLGQHTVNSMEIHVNVSTYGRALLQYFTTVLLGIACVVTVYILSSHGLVEGTNMIQFNRIAGLVWLGRPMMILRSVAAISLLATTNLVLSTSPNGLVSQIMQEPQTWLSTAISSGEITWLVYAVNDTFSIVTQQYTPTYSTASCVLSVLGTLLWSFISPIQEVVVVDRVCVVTSVDFDVLCMSGLIGIGSLHRVLGLVLLAFGCCAVCFVVQRIRQPHLAKLHKTESCLLHSAADFEFAKDLWQHRGVYFMDPASAALNGVLVFPWIKSTYILDIKTWRTCKLDEDNMLRNHNVPKHLAHCIPLVE